MNLTTCHPHLDATDLVQRFHPPQRFADVRFTTYVPAADYPTQTEALAALQIFANEIDTTKQSKRFWQRSTQSNAKPARYLDGGFGTGKTHLLASLWHAVPDPKAYVTFTELTAFIGFAGMTKAVEVFLPYKLLCIDEFELDDVANTLMVVSFLRGAMQQDLKLAVTSNTLPDRLGEQRFSAADFRREIAAIASYFDELRVDGPDYRTTHTPLALASHDLNDLTTIARDDFEAILAHLRTVHPVQYGALLDGIHGVTISGLRPIRDQDDALLFVQFVDKLYDARIPVRIDGCDVEDIFDASYRLGGYRKKYGRAESRLTAMKSESAGLL